ncbi:MAG: hypothetical protein ACRDD2_02780 [Sarcina sp.]
MKKTLVKHLSKFFYLVLGVLVGQLIEIFYLDKILFLELTIVTLIIVFLFELKGKFNFNIIKYKDIVK